jgi:hypothetical protein
MQTGTISKTELAEDFILSALAGSPSPAIYPPSLTWGKGWSVGCYWPNGDVLKDTRCDGRGPTLEMAVQDMWEKIEEVKRQAPILKTAAECKEAVLNLIREHDDAPASFRDAVDALPVKG